MRNSQKNVQEKENSLFMWEIPKKYFLGDKELLKEQIKRKYPDSWKYVFRNEWKRRKEKKKLLKEITKLMKKDSTNITWELKAQQMGYDGHKAIFSDTYTLTMDFVIKRRKPRKVKRK